MRIKPAEPIAELDLEELVRLGTVLDEPTAMLGGRTAGVFLAETLLKIRDRSGASVPLAPNRAQMEFERRRGRSNIVLKARQMGISTWVAGRFFLKTITRPGTLTMQVAHTQQAAEGIFRMVHRFLESLPTELREGALRTSRVSTRQIVFPALDSEYRVESAGDANAGRGLTVRNLHCSEVARWPGDAAETLQGLRASLPADGELVLESTPNGASGCFWQEWEEAEKTGTVRHFLPWWWEAAYVADAVAEDSLTEVELGLVWRHGLTLAQIGFRRRLEANFRRLTKQEYAEDATECFLTSGDCVFDVSAVDGRLKELRDPIAQRLGEALRIWYPPIAARQYVVAVDPAGGGSEGDFSAAQVVEIETGVQCAELQTKFGALELAEQVTLLAREYNNAWLVVERNNHGAGVLAYLHGVCRYARIYQQDGQDGWLTSSLSRPRMIGELGSALVETPGIFSSERLLKECRGFVRLRNGRTEAQAGSHDDCVMAMAIALSARAEMRAGRRERR